MVRGAYLPFSVSMHVQVNSQSQWLGWGIGIHPLSFSAMDSMHAHNPLSVEMSLVQPPALTFSGVSTGGSSPSHIRSQKKCWVLRPAFSLAMWVHHSSFSVAMMMGLSSANILNSHFSSMVASGNACSEPVILSGYECSPLIFSENEWRQSPFLVAIIGVKAPPPCSLAMIFQPPFLLSSRRHNEFKLQGARKACWCWVGVGGVHFLFREKWEVSRALPRSLVEDTKQGCCFLVRFPSCTKGHNE